MTFSIKSAVLAVMLNAPVTVLAAPVTLSPADPQPSADSLAAGLAVSYARIPGAVRDLEGAAKALERAAEPGTPLAGLAYDDGNTKVLTSDSFEQIAADISGYIRFEEAGIYTLDFLTNDGLELMIGGQQVALYDGIHSCGYAGEIEVEVPQAGYYPLQATYFQRKGTACLMMEWGPDSDGLDFVPDSAFFH